MSSIPKITLLAIVIITISCQTILSPIQNAQNLATTFTSRATTSSNPQTPERITVRLQKPPVYAYPGIITDFLINPALERSQNQIENMFQYQFSDNKFLPPRIFVSVGQKNDQIRVMFDYQNDIPFRPFSVRFRVTDPRNPVLGTASITLVYDSISGGISNALSAGRESEDYIR